MENKIININKELLISKDEIYYKIYEEILLFNIN